MSIGERIKRYVIMFAGIFCISMGVALLTKSDTGTSAISVIPYTLSIVLPQLTYGTWVALFNGFLVLLQLVLLRREAKVFDLCQQLVLCFFFGSFVDAAMFVLTYYNPEAYPLRLATLVVGVVVLAFGAWLTLISHVGVMAGDGFSRALSHVTGKEFGTCRVIGDSTMAGTAVVLNLVLFQTLRSVREGTLVSALFTGAIVGLFNHHLQPLEYVLLPENKRQAEVAAAAVPQVPQDNFVVTIAREYGSGGREIGRIIADELHIAYYDSEDIARMANERYHVVDDDAAEAVSSSAVANFYRLYAGGDSVTYQDLPRVDKIFNAEKLIIKRLASQGDCVIVGRLGRWVLEDHENTLDLFVGADMADRVEHVVERDGVAREGAEAKLAEVDKERAEHCRYCTGADWGDSRNYDITVNSSKYGISETGHMLAEAAKAAQKATDSRQSRGGSSDLASAAAKGGPAWSSCIGR